MLQTYTYQQHAINMSCGSDEQSCDDYDGDASGSSQTSVSASPKERTADIIIKEMFALMNKYQAVTKESMKVKLKIKCSSQKTQRIILITDKLPRRSPNVREVKHTHTRRSACAAVCDDNNSMEDVLSVNDTYSMADSP